MSDILRNIVLPAGISFYTFQSLSYVIDVYRKVIIPERNFLKYAAFLSFFPQLVAGPIVLARDFLPQLDLLWTKNLSQIPIRRVLFYFLLGILKKSILADRLAPMVELCFGYTEAFSSYSLWMGILAYSLQIYGDFSGYTDIARGTALIFGIELPENFNMPYTASRFSDFWRRWHISLSTWLRDYLYVSLGGNREGRFRTVVNLLLTMALGGIWHGANWTFLVWGLGHGSFLVLERLVQWGISGLPVGLAGVKVQKWVILGLKRLYGCLVVLGVIVLWVFFRAKDLSQALLYLKRMFSFVPGEVLGQSMQNGFFVLLFFTIVFHILGRNKKIQENINENKEISGAEIVIASFVLILCIVFGKETRPFIYFVF